MDVADAVHVLARELGRVAAAEEAVAGVEQQLGRRAGRRHEAVDLVRATRRSCPCGGGRRASGPGRRRTRRSPRRRRRSSPIRRRRHARGRRPAAGRRCRGSCSRSRRRCRPAAHRLQEVEVRLDRPLLVLDRAGEEVERVPAGDEAQPVRPSTAFSAAGSVGHLVALLDAVEADLAGLAQALSSGMSRRGSGRRRSTRRSGWCRRGSWALSPSALQLALARRSPRRARCTSPGRRDLGHRHVPPVAAGLGGRHRVGVDDDHRRCGRGRGRATSAASSSAMSATFSAWAPIDAAWAAKSIADGTAWRRCP